MKKLLGRLATILGAKPQASPTRREATPSSAQGSSQTPFVAFQPHNAIEQMLAEAAIKPDARMAFQQALLEADLYVATPDAPEAVRMRMAGEAESLSVLNVKRPDGVSVAAIFTAQERIVEVFGVGRGFVAMKGSVLLEMVASHGACLNPGSSYSVYWTPNELARILGKLVPRTVKKGTRINLGTPADPPTALIEALKATLSRDPRITEAWFALAHWPEDGKWSWYLDVRTELDGAVVQSLLDETLKHADYAGRPLDMIVNKPGGEQGSGMRIVPLHTH